MAQMFEPNEAEGTEPDTLPGCRLQRLELFNWGTFHQRAWTFDVDGRNALLTGDIGSGKSTLVDAITTLLLPANRISYNKAAGADTRERDLRSYVLGHYKSERNETTGASRPVALRDTSTYSVLLGVFTNSGYGETITLAQVFRARDQNQGQPDRFFVVADTELSIAKDFSDFGSDLRGLRRKLRERAARIYDSFPEYGKDLRRHLGIESDQALDLFHQTVSMKAVDNLNDFVRSHMLEPFDTRPRVESLITHFEDLTKAHEAVLRARAQLELLVPLIDDLDLYDGLAATIVTLNQQREALPLFFADRTKALLEIELERLAAVSSTLEARMTTAQSEEKRLRGEDEQLTIQIAGCGGDRLSRIDESIAACDREQPRRRDKFKRFNQLLRDAGLDGVSVADQFGDTRTRIDEREATLNGRLAQIEGDLTEHRHTQRALGEEAQSTNDELRSLESRQSNLPRRSLELRDQLCADLKIEPDSLPFAGELIQVRHEATQWEGAAERVLRNFALSLLVPDAHYDSVARWIDDHHLNARIVYFRVPQRAAPTPPPERRSERPLLVDMLEVKPDSAFQPWLDGELGRRANHLCVDSVAEFRMADKAVTRHGQIKDRSRHEKDDRHRIDDRRQYVLGWTNEQKIDALIADAAQLQTRMSDAAQRISGLEGDRVTVTEQHNKLVGLREYTSWDELDWESLVARRTELSNEAQRIRSSSNELQTLTAEQERVRAEIATVAAQVTQCQLDLGGTAEQERAAKDQLAQANLLLQDEGALTAARERFESIDQLMSTDVEIDITNLATVREVQQSVDNALLEKTASATTERHRKETAIVRMMGRFRAAYPQETAELDDSLASAPEYRELHERVATDDLPRFEREFKDYLNQNTIREIAGFSAQLNKQEQSIRERVETINRSLHGIDYNDGRYIRLLPDRSPNTEVREFREELRACTDNVVGGDEASQYSEERFLQVKRIVDRFKGREGCVDIDRNWTRRVTDVRQWFVFSASERWRADDSEHESYTDSAGKSGGQKEKLAYTILAASLAYQFKLDFDTARSKAFRFVVIDEAFGRGSEVSTRYALNLFTRLGLQLLIVTPLQKIHVIEPHVSSVGFVDNLDGNFSRLQCLTIAEYRRRRRQPG